MFAELDSLPVDPLLGLITQFNQDPRKDKIDLGVGVFKDDRGEMPVLKAIKEAEAHILNAETSKTYVGALGNQNFNALMAQLIFQEHPRLASAEIQMLQTAGGCGALRVIGEFIKRVSPQSTVWVSSPTWANHIPLLSGAGLVLKEYPYFDPVTQQVDVNEMLSFLEANLKAGDYVLLHACCHNPSGADLSPEAWQQVVGLLNDKSAIAFVDMAYQGFGDGLEDDAFGLNLIASECDEALFAVSCSKNFGLYRERVGAAGVISRSARATKTAISYFTNIVRGIYSMPPSHGAMVVETILSSELLRAQWLEELSAMRERIHNTRVSLCSELRETRFQSRFDFLEHHKGMFSFLGITQEEVAKLASDYGIYLVDSSRVNLAGLNRNNLNYFVGALDGVLE